MAIEGPLRELSIHDVFQLLDLSSNTGTLRVTSELRDDEGTVHFANGRITQASIRSRPLPVEQLLLASGKITDADLASARDRAGTDANQRALADALVDGGAVSRRELERQVRQQVETVVFDLMSWHEGFFSFEDITDASPAGDLRISVSIESLLMEGARRIDEWSRIVHKVPNVQVVPQFAAVAGGHEAQLDLLPHEWEVLTMIDGERDLHEIAASLGRSDFEVAKVAYGLLTTGVVELGAPGPAGRDPWSVAAEQDAPMMRAQDALAGGDFECALAAARAAVATHGTAARLLAARSLVKLQRYPEALAELQSAVHADPLTPRVHFDLGFVAVRVGDFAAAQASFAHFLRLSPGGPEEARVRSSLESLGRLMTLLEAHADD